MKLRIALLTFLLIVNGISANSFTPAFVQKNTSQNDTLLPKVLEQLNLTDKDIRKELFVEKVLPDNKSLTVMVIPKISKKEFDADGNGYFEFDAYILVVESETGKIISKFFEPKAWTSDAVVISSIEIDTAPFTLNSKARGFGIRVNYSGSSRPNPYNQTDFSLFIINGDSLKRVLKDYPISEGHGEWDTNCAGKFENVESVISIGKQKSYGFNNIIIKQKITKTKNSKIKDDCKEKSTIKHKSITLKFNKREYK